MFLIHFNPNHDRKNGQFTSGSGGSVSVNQKVKNARKTGNYDMEFLERGLDQDQRTGELLKGKALDDAYKKYLSEKNNKKNSTAGGLDDLKKDKNIDFGDISYNQQASEKITKDDISTIYSLKDKTGEITKIIKSNSDFNDMHSKLERLSKKVKSSKDLSFNYSGLGGDEDGNIYAQFDGYNDSTDVGFTIVVNKDGRMIIDLDYWG